MTHPLALMPLDDELEDEVDPRSSAMGIMECLRILAAEAAHLKLSRTMVALREALVACESEGLLASTGLVTLRNGARLH